MELFFELCPATIIGVTGSDGKTTTTTLIAKLIEKHYGRVFVGGNIGSPLVPRLEEMNEDDFAVVELSSFQLQTMKRSPHISVVTNLSPNHLDYHIDMQEYIDAKRNIYRHQRPGDRLVLNAANDITRAMKTDARDGVTVTMFMDNELREGVYEAAGEDGRNTIYRHGVPVLATEDIRIPGHHNVENFMAVIGALEGLVDDSEIAELAESFAGVEHRIELVRELDGVKFYNSSIDSSPTRTIAALNSFLPKYR